LSGNRGKHPACKNHVPRILKGFLPELVEEVVGVKSMNAGQGKVIKPMSG